MDVDDRPAIGSQLIRVLEVAELDVDTVLSPACSLILGTTVLLPVMVDVVQTTEGDERSIRASAKPSRCLSLRSTIARWAKRIGWIRES